MASIWIAEDDLLGRRVAVKVLAENLALQEPFVRRFKREARMAAKLSGHPNVVAIFDVGESDGRPFIVMEHLQGGTLADRLANGPPPRDQVVAWLRQAAAALDFANERGVVHRDVKPRNLLFDERGRLVIADFGIARAAYEAGVTEALTASGDLLGTAAYISPEQARGDQATAASDRYALAVVAFELLTGSLPFKGGDFAETASGHIYSEPPRASDRAPALPPAVDEVMSRALAKNPIDRWPSANAFVEALASALGHGTGDPRGADTDRRAPAAAPLPKGDDTTASGYAGYPIARAHRRRATTLVIAATTLAAVVAGVLIATAITGDDENSGRRPDRAADNGPRAEGRNRTERPRGEPQPSPGAPRAGSESPAALNDQGFALMKAGRYDEAIRLLRPAVAAFPADSGELTYAYALFNLGRSLRLAGRPEEAIPILERRLRIPNQRETVAKELRAARRAAE
jgi:serine/threonine-protein kinase